MSRPMNNLGIPRRDFVKWMLAGGVANALSLIGHGQAFADSLNGKTLICIFQRGANDGINTIIPLGEPLYYSTHRPQFLAIPQPDVNDATSAVAVPGNSFFGFHPRLCASVNATTSTNASFKTYDCNDGFLGLWNAGKLAIFPSVNYNNNSLSHFRQQDLMESIPSDNSTVTVDGYMNRYMQTNMETLNLRAASIGSSLFKSMRGTAVIPTFASLNGYQLYNPSTNNPYGDSQIRSIVDGYINSSFTQEPMSAKVYGELVAEYGRKLLSDIALIKQITTDQQVIDAGFIDPTTGLPAYQNGAMYPGTVNGSGATNGSIVTINGVQTFVPTPTTLSAQLRDVAHIIRVGKAFPGYNVGLRVACMDHTGGYDTHSAQGKGEAGGTQSKLLFEMSHAIHAFFQDLGMFQSDPTKNYAKDVIVLVQTEFGRTVAENFSKGTDHGVGSCWFAVGGGIKGGMYYDVTQSSDSQGYSLATSNLDSGRYLRRTVVYKDILEDIFRNHLGVSATDASSVIRRKTSDPTEATFKPTGMFT